MAGIIQKITGANKYLIDQEDLKALMKSDKKSILIDVRTYPEYKMDHVNPSQNLSIQEGKFDDQIKYLKKEDFYILICKSGRRSAKARKKMSKLGFENVFVLDGGLQRWVGQKKVK